MKSLSLCWQNGKTGVLTTSWDDGGVADRRLIPILNGSGLKGTWNLNSGLLGIDQGSKGWERRIGPEEVSRLYSGHEVAAHSVTHPALVDMPDHVVFSEVIEDRRKLESLVGYPIKGMALPFGATDQRVRAILDKCGILYARNVEAKPDFKLPVDFLDWSPTCHHKADLSALWEQFKSATQTAGKLFYLWGHSWEFEDDRNWDHFEKFSAAAGKDEETWHATNYQVYEYVSAWRRLITTVDLTAVLNPSSVKLWFRAEGELLSIDPGQILHLGN
jgi:hypothetical protein